MQTFTRSVTLPVDRDTAFAWHEREGTFSRLQPPWEAVDLVEGPTDGLREGSRVVLRSRVGPFALCWELHHEAYRSGHQFMDVMDRGPFRSWRHWHRFHDAEDGGSRLEDFIRWSLPLPWISEPLMRGWVNRKLERMFAYRHAVTREDLARLSPAPPRPRTILVAGGTGLVGQALVPLLQTRGHHVRILTRSPKGRPGHYAWDPRSGRIDHEALEGVDVLINLAGETIAQRWTTAARKRILDSRVQSADTLAAGLREAGHTVERLIGVSGVGFYGYKDAGVACEETAPPGEGFLASVCRDWEAATRRAGACADRTILPRLGVVLTPAGGALKKMLPAFRAGLGGPIGSGGQPMPVIGIEDVAWALTSMAEGLDLEGPVNLAIPSRIENREFGKTLGKALRRPAILPLPGCIVRTLFGQMGEEALLGGVAVSTEKLTAAGYTFRHPDLKAILDSSMPMISQREIMG